MSDLITRLKDEGLPPHKRLEAVMLTISACAHQRDIRALLPLRRQMDIALAELLDQDIPDEDREEFLSLWGETSKLIEIVEMWSTIDDVNSAQSPMIDL